jgi:hypothetical protein
MKKSELKTGMWVEYEDGEKACVMLGTKEKDILISDENWLGLNAVMDDLSSRSTNCSIIKVYEAKNTMSMFNGEHLKLLWEREPEIIEMTLEEACKKLRDTMGKPVKITI